MESGIRQGYAVTVGFFDGVHTGHRHLMECLKECALNRGLGSRVVTFAEHPCRVLRKDYQPLLLTTPERKTELLKECGTDLCTTLHFTEELASMTAREFMEKVLVNELNARCLVMGYDHRFGCECFSDINEYRRIGEGIGLEVIQCEALIYDNAPVSSSRIRRSLAKGEMTEANDMLGYPYSLSGTVVHGLKNGRKMGFPTANMSLHSDDLQLPADGVYSAWATVGGETFKSMLNIGFRPTIAGARNDRTIEAHLLDFDRDIYGEELTVRFAGYIRPERKFDDLQSLSQQLKYDKDLIDRSLNHTDSLI